MIVSDMFLELFAIKWGVKCPKARKSNQMFELHHHWNQFFKTTENQQKLARASTIMGNSSKKNTKGEQKLSRVTMPMGKQACAKGIESNNAR